MKSFIFAVTAIALLAICANPVRAQCPNGNCAGTFALVPVGPANNAFLLNRSLNSFNSFNSFGFQRGLAFVPAPVIAAPRFQEVREVRSIFGRIRTVRTIR